MWEILAVLLLGAGTVVMPAAASASTVAHPNPQIPTPWFDGPSALASNGTDVWVANGAGNSVTELDATTGGVLRVLSAPRYGFQTPSAITYEASRLWVANEFGGPRHVGSVTEISAKTGGLIRVVWGKRYGLHDPLAIAAGAGRIWVSSSVSGVRPTSLTELDGSTGSLVKLFTAPRAFGDPGAMAVWGKDLWITNGNRELVTQFRLRTSRVRVRLIRGGRYHFDFPSDIASNGVDVWTANTFGNSLTEFGASSGAVVTVRDGPRYHFDFPSAICWSGHAIWVANWAGNSLTKLKPKTAKLVRVLSAKQFGFDGPIAIASSGRRLWVANQDGDSITELSAKTGAVVQVIRNGS